jgi:hypothetical protein
VLVAEREELEQLDVALPASDTHTATHSGPEHIMQQHG